MDMPASLTNPRKRLARIKCLLECINCMKERREIIPSLCYVPAEVIYRCQSDCRIKLYPKPSKKVKKLCDVKFTSESRLYASGDEYCNSQGKWLKVLKVSTFVLSSICIPLCIYKCLKLFHNITKWYIYAFTEAKFNIQFLCPCLTICFIVHDSFEQK